MQISGNPIGHSFFSAYKLASAPARQAPSENEDNSIASAPNAVFGVQNGDDKKEGRDALLLQSAHRSAGRTADLIEAMPVL